MSGGDPFQDGYPEISLSGQTFLDLFLLLRAQEHDLEPAMISFLCRMETILYRYLSIEEIEDFEREYQQRKKSAGSDRNIESGAEYE